VFKKPKIFCLKNQTEYQIKPDEGVNMKNIFIAFALMVTATFATAQTHYTRADGVLVYGNRIADRVSTTYTSDAYGRQVRVVTTVSCSDTRVDLRDTLYCAEETTTEERYPINTYDDNYRPGYGIVTPYFGGYYGGYYPPVIINRGFHNGYRGDNGWHHGGNHGGNHHGGHR
jgi:hypothetical protein